MNRSKDDAYLAIRNSHYRGESMRFGFEQYTQIHVKAHRTLDDYGEPVPEPKKVRDFLERISANEMTAAKATVISQAHLLNDFKACADYLAYFVFDKKSHRQDRSIASLGRVRGRGGRGHGGRGGRGRGRGRGCGRPSVRTRHYSSKEWEQFSVEERNKVLQMRQDTYRKKRKAASVTIVEPAAEESKGDDDETPENAGNQFAIARKAKKKR